MSRQGTRDGTTTAAKTSLKFHFVNTADPVEMELSCIASPRSISPFSSASPSSSSPSSSFSSSSYGCCSWRRERRKVAEWAQIKASAEGSHKRINTEGAGESRPRGFAAGGPVMEVSASPASASTTTTTVIERSFAGSGDSEFPVWERLGAVVRLSYGIG